jgi:hypothetical protein
MSKTRPAVLPDELAAFAPTVQAADDTTICGADGGVACLFVVVGPGARVRLRRLGCSMSIQQAGQPARLMGPDGDLLDDPDTAALTHRCDYEVLKVD